MKKIMFVALLSSLLFANSDAYKACLDKAVATVDMMSCTLDEVDREDKRLNSKARATELYDMYELGGGE